MRKIALLCSIAAMFLSSLSMQAQHCDTVTIPWHNDFETDFECWHRFGVNDWYISNHNASNYYLGDFDNTPNDSSDRIITSPAISLPNDSIGLRLEWCDHRKTTRTTHYAVLITTSDRTDLSTYDTLQTFTLTNNNWTTRTVDLSPYAGQTVSIAFFRYYNTSAESIIIKDVSIYSDRMPRIGNISSSHSVIHTNDSILYSAVLEHAGDTTIGAYLSWHSSLLDSTHIITLPIENDTLEWALSFPVQGIDTVTLSVITPFGSQTQSNVVYVHTCTTITNLPWTENFEFNGSYSLCWIANEFSHNNPGSPTSGTTDEDGQPWSYDNCMYSSSTNCYLISPEISIPTNAEHLVFKLSHFTVNGIVWVRVSPTAATDTSQFTDTLISFNNANNIKVTKQVSLAEYAGQTIRLGVFFKESSSYTYTTFKYLSIFSASVDYDTLPKIDAITSPNIVPTNSPTLCTVKLRHGPTTGLHYNWTSSVGGTIASNTMGDSIWVTYTTGGCLDTLTVVATNIFGNDTLNKKIHVADCNPVTTIPWHEEFKYGHTCWYKPEGSNWEYTETDAVWPNEGYMRSRCASSTLDSWMISKAINIPHDTMAAIVLSWTVLSQDVGIGHNPNQFAHNYSVWITTDTDYTDTANYELLYIDSSSHSPLWENRDIRTVSLAAYAGQAVHVAFRNHPTSANGYIMLALYNVEVRSSSAPTISLITPQEVNSLDSVTYMGILTEGLPCTYIWHSTLLDRTDTMSYADTVLWSVAYPVGGTDTVTLVASNTYGNDTVYHTVTVHHCSVDNLPWSENFNNSLELPSCWITHWDYHDIIDMPQIAYLYSYSWYSTHFPTLTSFALYMAASSDLDTVVIVETPWFSNQLRDIHVSLWYAYENHTHGQLSLGYMQNGAFVSIVDLPAVDSLGQYDTVDLGTFPTDIHRIAFQWKDNGTGFYSCLIDDIQVISTDTSSAIPDTVWHSVSVTTNAVGACEPYGSGIYAHGDTVTIGYAAIDTVTDGGHWEYIGWNDSVWDNPRTIIVTSDTVFTVCFRWVDDTSSAIPDTIWHNVSVTTNAVGACEPYGSGIYAHGDTVTIGYAAIDTVTDGGHWEYIGWNDSVWDSPRTIVVTSDTVFTVCFRWVDDSTISAVEQVEYSSEFVLYPNPASHTVTVKCGMPALITLFNIQGCKFGQWKTYNDMLVVDISTIPCGTYFVHVQTGLNTTVMKLTVTR